MTQKGGQNPLQKCRGRSQGVPGTHAGMQQAASANSKSPSNQEWPSDRFTFAVERCSLFQGGFSGLRVQGGPLTLPFLACGPLAVQRAPLLSSGGRAAKPRPQRNSAPCRLPPVQLPAAKSHQRPHLMYLICTVSSHKNLTRQFPVTQKQNTV